jgi:glycine cleavage system H protein
MAYPADRKYTKDHEWIRLSGETAEIGITEYAQQQLGEVVFVDLPEPGATLTAGQPFGSIESVKAVSELFAPASGEVLEVNAAVKTHPDAISTAPHDTWMVRIRLSDPGALGDLLDSTRYEGLLQ